MAAKRTRTPAPPHEDFYKRLRERVAEWSTSKSINPRYREYVLALPDLFHLVVKLMVDKRVDPVSKAVLGAAVAWAISPIDLLPDMLGPLGVVDDLLVIALALDFMLDRTPRAVVTEHWAGTGDVFTIIRTVLDQADKWVGRGLYRRVRDLMGRTSATAQAVTPSAPAKRRAPKRAPKRAAKTAARRAAPKKASRPKAAAPAARPAPKKKVARKQGGRA